MVKNFVNKSLQPVSWWTRERVRNGLLRYARDFFEGDEANLPLRLFSYRKAVPESERRRAKQFRLYPPYAVVLRYYESLLDGWRDVGLEVKNRPNKNVPADIAGERFGWLKAIEYSHSAPGSGRIWRLKCRCGKEVFAAVKNLLRGRVVSCGCYRRTVLARQAGQKLIKDLRGRKFGRFSPQFITGKKGSESLWKCVCDCGNSVNLPVSSLTSRGVRSCGCLRDEKGRERFNGYWKEQKEKAI